MHNYATKKPVADERLHHMRLALKSGISLPVLTNHDLHATVEREAILAEAREKSRNTPIAGIASPEGLDS